MNNKKGHQDGSPKHYTGNTNASLMEIEDAVRDKMRAHGVTPPDVLILDNTLHRASGNGKTKDKGLAYKINIDGIPSVYFQDYRQGVKVSERLDVASAAPMSPRERLELKQRAEKQRYEASQKLAAQYEAVAAEVWALWKTAPVATANHPYLVSKGIGPHIAKQLDSDLWVPLYDTSGKLWTIQSIGVNGFKMLWKGGKKAGNFCLLNKRLFELDTMEMAYMVEGFATASSVAERYPDVPVFCAIDSGNLLKVTANIKKRWPYLAITIISDNDRKAESEGKKNIGVVSAKAVANQFANVFVEIPNFPKDAPLELSDFNDLVQYHKASMGGVIDE